MGGSKQDQRLGISAFIALLPVTLVSRNEVWSNKHLVMSRSWPPGNSNFYNFIWNKTLPDQSWDSDGQTTPDQDQLLLQLWKAPTTLFLHSSFYRISKSLSAPWRQGWGHGYPCLPRVTVLTKVPFMLSTTIFSVCFLEGEWPDLI